MSPSEVSNITLTAPQPSAIKSQPSSPERESVSAVPPPSSKENQAATYDTVSLLNNELQSKSEKEAELARKQAADRLKNKEKPSRAIGDIDFAYTFNGDLRVRFMDRKSRLIYQIPPELVARVEDSISQPVFSVDTRV